MYGDPSFLLPLALTQVLVLPLVSVNEDQYVALVGAIFAVGGVSKQT
jgi:hypothetical protein